MKKIILINFLYIITELSYLFSCPYEFSHDDQRPFFEQYDMENNKKNIEEHNTRNSKEIENEKK